MERAKEAARGQTLLVKGRRAELCQLGLRRTDHMRYKLANQRTNRKHQSWREGKEGISPSEMLSDLFMVLMN